MARSLPAPPAGDLWVFAYGSLMWKPGFPFAESHLARLHGYHRSLCIWSVVHRGTRRRPGLVFGLDAGGSCVGMAYRVPPKSVTPTLEYLVERELVTDVYHPRLHRVHIPDGAVQALTFVVDRGHWQYAGRPSMREVTATVATARGRSGANRDYVTNTFTHLQELGIYDPHLDQISQALRDHRS